MVYSVKFLSSETDYEAVHHCNPPFSPYISTVQIAKSTRAVLLTRQKFAQKYYGGMRDCEMTGGWGLCSSCGVAPASGAGLRRPGGRVVADGDR